MTRIQCNTKQEVVNVLLAYSLSLGQRSSLAKSDMQTDILDLNDNWLGEGFKCTYKIYVRDNGTFTNKELHTDVEYMLDYYKTKMYARIDVECDTNEVRIYDYDKDQKMFY